MRGAQTRDFILLLTVATAVSLAAGFWSVGVSAQSNSTDSTETEEVGAESGGRTIFDGIYTEEQAAAGKEHYMGDCSSCHGTAARGGTGAPGLIAYTFDRKYAGQPLFNYFDFMRHNMPPGNAGWFADEEYLEITAFLLQIHGAPAGDTELPLDEEELNAIEIVPTPEGE